MASDVGSTVFTYGKYRNQTFEQVRQQDASYCKWVRGLPSPNGVLKEFKQFLNGGPAAAPGPPRAPGGGQFQQPQQRQPHQSQTGSQPNAATAATARGGQQSQPRISNSTLIVELQSSGEFRIFAPAYLDSSVWQAVSALKLGTWVSEKRHWVFAAGQYDEVTSKLHGHPALTNCSVEFPPDWVLAKFDSFSRSRAPISRIAAPRRVIARGATSGGNVLDKMPAKTRDQLMPYQQEGVQFGVAHGGRCLIGDEMGLGKTLQALGIVANYREDWPCLVIAPSSMRFVWRDQIVEWLDVQAEQVQVLTNGKERLNGQAQFVVVSYNLVAKQDRFQKRADGSPYMTIIVDESQFVKEHKSQRTKATVAICKSAKRALMLSGTAAVNRAAELFTQLDALMPGEIPSFLCFVERYCEQVITHLPGRKVVKWTGSRCTGELNLFLSNSVMIRRLKKDVLSQLPDKTRQRLVLDGSQMDKVATNKLEKLMQDIDENDKQNLEAHQEGGDKEEDKDKRKGLENITNLFKLTAEAKAGAVLEHVEMLLETDVKFLCFAHHGFMLDRVEQQLQHKRVDYIRIDGRTKQEERPELVSRFQQQESVRVAVLSITACGQGLTLTAASHVVFAELYWVPGQLLQAEDRVHRIGQKSACLIQYLIAPKTMDERIFKMINRKACVVSGILNGEVKGMIEPEPSAGQKNFEDEEAKTCAALLQETPVTQQIALAANDNECASVASSQQKSPTRAQTQQMQQQQQQQQQQQLQQQQQEEVEKECPATDRVSPAVAEQSQRGKAAGVGVASSDANAPCMQDSILKAERDKANQVERAENTVDPEEQTEQAEPAKPAEKTNPKRLLGPGQPTRQIGQADEERQAGREQRANQADGMSVQDDDTDDDIPMAALLERSQDGPNIQRISDVQSSNNGVPGEKRKASGMEHASQGTHNESPKRSNAASSSNLKDRSEEEQSVGCAGHAASTVEAKPCKHENDANLSSAERSEANHGKHSIADNIKQTTNCPSTNKRKADEAAIVHRQKLPPTSHACAARIPGLRIACARTLSPLTSVSPVKGTSRNSIAAGFNHPGDQGAVKRRTLGQRLGAAEVGRAVGGS